MPKPWADTPFSLIPTPTPQETEGISDPTVTIATEMALAHNVMVRNLNAIYQQAPHVTLPVDISDFILYCKFSLQEIAVHHTLEETDLFPAIAEYTGVPEVMEGNLAQHHAFEVGLKVFKEYLVEVTPETYDGKKVREMVNSFGSILAVHLKDEIGTLLGLDKYGGDKLIGAYRKMEKALFANMADKDIVLPVGFGGNDVTFEGGKHKWPPVPFFLPYLVKYFFARKYKGAWRFCPTTFTGQPRPLEFAVDEE